MAEEKSLALKEEKALEPHIKSVYREMRLAIGIARDLGILKLGERGRFQGCITFDSKTPQLIDVLREKDPLKAHLIRSVYDTWRDWREGMLFRIHFEELFESERMQMIKCAFSSDLCDKNKRKEELRKQDKERNFALWGKREERKKELIALPELKEEYRRRRDEAEREYFREYPRKRVWDPDKRRETTGTILDELLERDPEYVRRDKEWTEAIHGSPETVALEGEVYSITRSPEFRDFSSRVAAAFNDAVETAMSEMQTSNQRHCGKALRDPIEIWKALGL